MPYGALGRSQYPNLLAEIDQNKVAFSIFDGDLHARGDGPCSDSLYTTALANFNTLERPLVWVPVLEGRSGSCAVHHSIGTIRIASSNETRSSDSAS